MNNLSNLELLLGTWGTVTAVLIVLAMHRSIAGFRGEEHIFAEGEGCILQQEQAEALRRVTRVNPWITGLTWLSGALLLTAAIVWLYPGVAALFGR